MALVKPRIFLYSLGQMGFLDGLVDVDAITTQALFSAQDKLRDSVPDTSILVGVAFLILIALGMFGYVM